MSPSHSRSRLVAPLSLPVNSGPLIFSADAEASLSGKWCCRGGLNSRPLPYQGSALPLSYGSAGRRAAMALLVRKRRVPCHKAAEGASDAGPEPLLALAAYGSMPILHL